MKNLIIKVLDWIYGDISIHFHDESYTVEVKKWLPNDGKWYKIQTTIQLRHNRQPRELEIRTELLDNK